MGKKIYLIDELGETTVELMRKVKRAIDPDNLFNPGKVCGLAPFNTLESHTLPAISRREGTRKEEIGVITRNYNDANVNHTKLMVSDCRSPCSLPGIRKNPCQTPSRTAIGPSPPSPPLLQRPRLPLLRPASSPTPLSSSRDNLHSPPG